MTFEMTQKVLFKHCDPAGIVFFPRYFEMMNDCVETFFAQGLKYPFEDLHRTAAVPTAQIETRFARPSHHGDILVLQLGILHVGTTSTRYEMNARCGEELRFATTATLVYVDASGKAVPWPDPLRKALCTYEGKKDVA